MGVATPCPVCSPPRQIPGSPDDNNEEAARRSWRVWRRVGTGRASWERLSRGQQREMNDVLALWCRAAAPLVDGEAAARNSPVAGNGPTFIANEQGCLDACVNLAFHLVQGAGCTPDKGKALAWLRVAASGGVSTKHDGIADSASRHETRKAGLAGDDDRETVASSGGHPKAQYILAANHFVRVGAVHRSFAPLLSSSWNEFGVSSNSSEGRGVPQKEGGVSQQQDEENEAFHWLLAAAGRGRFAEAEFLLGLLVLSGRVETEGRLDGTVAAGLSHGGVAELRPCVHLFLAVSGSPTSLQVGDMATSRKWLERAAKQGHSKAQVILRFLWLWPFLRRFQLALGHLGMSLAELPINRVVESAAAVFLLLLISRLAFL